MTDIEILQEKADLVKSAQYKKVREYQLEKIVDLSSSDIDEKELKGMLRLIKHTDSWVNDYENKKKNLK